MVSGGYEDDIPSGPQSQPPINSEPSEPLLTGSEYPSESGPEVCPPEVEQAEPSDRGGYEDVTGKAPCAPELELADVNASGEYADPNSNNVQPPTNEHDEDCDCDECCFYTEEVPNTEKIGGHEQGQTYDNVPMREMWYQLLHPYQYPSITLSLGQNILEVGEILNAVNFNWSTQNPQNTQTLSTAIWSKSGLLSYDIVANEVATLTLSAENVFSQIISASESGTTTSNIEVNVFGLFSGTEEATLFALILKNIVLFETIEESATTSMNLIKYLTVNQEAKEEGALSGKANLNITTNIVSNESGTALIQVKKNVSGNLSSLEYASFVGNVEIVGQWMLANGYWADSPWTGDGIWKTT